MTMISMSVDATLSKSLPEAFNYAYETAVVPLFRQFAGDAVDYYVAENKDQPFTLEIDGKNAVTISSVRTLAKRVVRLNFIQAAVDLAVSEMRSVLAESMRTRALTSLGGLSTFKDRLLSESEIAIFYSETKGSWTKISSSSEIKNFKPGDAISLVPTFYTQAYANVVNPESTSPQQKIPSGGGGYMGLAARRIRAKMRYRKSTSSLIVRAQRSRKAWGYLNAARPAGATNITHPGWGVWTIMIAYKDTTYRTIGG
jgi:hypothetical protein